MSTGPSDPFGSQPVQESGQGAQQMTGQAQHKVQELAGQAQQQAQQAMGQARNRLQDQLDQRTTAAGAQIADQASDLRAVSASLREQGKDAPASLADRLAEYGERVGGYLRERDSDALLADVEDFGRRQPWAVAAGGVALGFAASRFLKASSSRRYSSRFGSEARAGYGSPSAYDASPTNVSSAASPSPSALARGTPLTGDVSRGGEPSQSGRLPGGELSHRGPQTGDELTDIQRAEGQTDERSAFASQPPPLSPGTTPPSTPPRTPGV